jgi:hypothetical protein
LTIDLLDSSRFLALSRDPSALERLVTRRRGDWVVIDEIQRIPALLDELHRLDEQKRGIHFALSGSSARKLRRAGANLLAGRALQLHMYPFVWPEYRGVWRIDQAVEWGTLPLVVSDPAHRAATLATYVETYLKEEITAEALVRSLDPFVRVLQVAGLDLDTVDSVWKSFAFEALLHHEMRAYAATTGKERPIFHYSVSGGFDVDFLVQTRPKTLLRECGDRVRRGIIVYQGVVIKMGTGADLLPLGDPNLAADAWLAPFLSRMPSIGSVFLSGSCEP